MGETAEKCIWINDKEINWEVDGINPIGPAV